MCSVLCWLSWPIIMMWPLVIPFFIHCKVPEGLYPASGCCLSSRFYGFNNACSLLFHLSFCKSNVINHFFHDFLHLLGLPCSDTSINEILMSILCVCFGFECCNYFPLLQLYSSYYFQDELSQGQSQSPHYLCLPPNSHILWHTPVHVSLSQL